MITGKTCPHMWTDLSFALYELDIGPNKRLNLSTFLIWISVASFARGVRMTQKRPDSFCCMIWCAHTSTHAGSAVALQILWGTQEWAWDVKPLVPPCSQGSNKNKLLNLCCWSIDDVAIALLIPARIMEGRIPAWAWCGKGGGFLQEQDQSHSLAR